MNRPSMVRILAALVAAALAQAEGAAAAGKPEAPRPSPSVKMEELEVRGIRGDPPRLFVPGPAEMSSPCPANVDFLAEDLAEPIPFRQVLEELETRKGGDTEHGRYPD